MLQTVQGAEGHASWFRRLRKSTQAEDAHPGRDSLLEYAKAVYRGFLTPKHIVEIAELIEAVDRGDVKRAIVVQPPRRGKSLLMSQIGPSWLLGRDPDRQMIHASYAEELVSTFGRRVRNFLEAEEHLRIFPKGGIDPDSRSVTRFDMRHGIGKYLAAGVGGGITGHGADIAIIDDPVRGHEDADSETIRERIWDWWRSDMRSRIMPGGRVIIIGTRWHTDDLIGRLLEQDQGRGQWTLLHHPAVDDFGRSLWPEMWPIEEMREIERDVGPREWNSLYQGNPAPDEGSYFKRDWFKRGPRPDASELKLYGASDYAVSEGKNDWTVHLVLGIDGGFRPWVVDMWRERTTSEHWIPPLISMMQEWRPQLWLEEKGVIDKAVGPMIDREQTEAGAWTMREGLSSAADKPTRARAVQWMMERYGLWFDTHCPYYGAVTKELLEFPHGKNDDIVDCFSLIGRKADELRAGTVQAPRARSRPFGSMTLDEALEREDRIRGGGRYR